MASTSSSSTDEIQLRKEISSVQKDDVSMDAETKIDLLEAYNAENGRSSTLLRSDSSQLTRLVQKNSFYNDCIMERDPLEEIDAAKNGGSSTLIHSDSSSDVERNDFPIDREIEEDLSGELDTAENGGSSTLQRPNYAEMEREQRESHRNLHESNKADDSHLKTAKTMNPELFKAVIGGKIAFIKKEARDMECSSLFETSPNLNTILHILTSSGQKKLVKEILETKGCQKLVKEKNSTDNLSLHVAVSVGHLPTVKLLLSSYKKLEESSSSFEQLRVKNKEGNTPLHVALIKKYEEVAFKTKYNEVARYLVENLVTNSDDSIFLINNNESKSPLYLAAEAGDAELFKLIMDKFTCLGKHGWQINCSRCHLWCLY